MVKPVRSDQRSGAAIRPEPPMVVQRCRRPKEAHRMAQHFSPRDAIICSRLGSPWRRRLWWPPGEGPFLYLYTQSVDNHVEGGLYDAL